MSERRPRRTVQDPQILSSIRQYYEKLDDPPVEEADSGSAAEPALSPRARLDDQLIDGPIFEVVANGVKKSKKRGKVRHYRLRPGARLDGAAAIQIAPAGDPLDGRSGYVAALERDGKVVEVLPDRLATFGRARLAGHGQWGGDLRVRRVKQIVVPEPASDLAGEEAEHARTSGDPEISKDIKTSVASGRGPLTTVIRWVEDHPLERYHATLRDAVGEVGALPRYSPSIAHAIRDADLAWGVDLPLAIDHAGKIHWPGILGDHDRELWRVLRDRLQAGPRDLPEDFSTSISRDWVLDWPREVRHHLDTAPQVACTCIPQVVHHPNAIDATIWWFWCSHCLSRLHLRPVAGVRHADGVEERVRV